MTGKQLSLSIVKQANGALRPYAGGDSSCQACMAAVIVFLLAVITMLLPTCSSLAMYAVIWGFLAGCFLLTGGGNGLIGQIAAMRATQYLFENLPKRNYHAIERVLRKCNSAVLVMQGQERDMCAGIMLSNLALMRLYQGDYEDAELLLREAHTYTARSKKLSTSRTMALVKNNLAVVCLYNDKPFEAEDLARQALSLWKEQFGADQTGACMTHLVLGSINLEMSELDDAQLEVQTFQSIAATGRFPSGFCKDSLLQAQANAQLLLSIIYARQEHYALAKDAADKFLVMAGESPRSVSTMTLRHLNELAQELLNMQEYARAERVLEIAYGLGRQFHNHPEAIKTLAHFESLLLVTDRADDVSDLKRWIRPLQAELAIAGCG